jgi:hypothetical protein
MVAEGYRAEDNYPVLGEGNGEIWALVDREGKVLEVGVSFLYGVYVFGVCLLVHLCE